MESYNQKSVMSNQKSISATVFLEDSAFPKNATALEILQWCQERFNENEVCLSTSFGAEGMCLLSLLHKLQWKPRIFTVDTGRNFQQTYDVWHEAESRYDIKIECFAPDPWELQNLIASDGVNGFYNSVEARKRCCEVRKTRPLQRALKGAKLWITGLRREQTSNRRQMDPLNYSDLHGLYKVCPLIEWTEQNVWEYIRNNSVPYNKLHDEGYPTVGCCPCSRPPRRGEGDRSGRWWWEKDDARECGIHIEGGKMVRNKQPPNFNI